MNKVYLGDCLDLMKDIEDNYIDLTVTSPPYDNTKNYNNSLVWSFDIFKNIAKELYRITKNGGIVTWVVGDKTENGSETGTSFMQALYFKELGFNLHDTMIYKKINYVPLTHNRYEQEFEYIFVLSKGKPKTFNPIKIPCKYAGTETWGKPTYYKTSDDVLVEQDRKKINDNKIKGNIFEYRIGSTQSKGIKHPAIFPLELAQDMVSSWSNDGDTILDCFAGSGTTAIACINTNRNYILMEKEQKYYDIINKRIAEHINQVNLF